MSIENPISMGVDYVFLGPKKWLENKEVRPTICAVCEKPRAEFDKYMRVYCSEKCSDKFNSKLIWPAKLRELTLKRDNYTCVKCGYTNKGKHTFLSLGLQADHILAKMNGGDEWDINNMQTLCDSCHKIKTKEDHSDRKIYTIQSKHKKLFEEKTK